MKKKLFIICALVVGVLASGSLFIERSKGDNSPDEACTGPGKKISPFRTVVVAEVATIESRKNTLYPGSVNAFRETELAFRVAGPLINVNVQAGDSVKQGDILMQIDPQDFKDKIYVLDANLSSSTSKLQNAEQDFMRMKRLLNKEVIPQSDFDRAKSTRDMARADVRNVEAQLAIARHQLEYTSLVAPYDGIITAQMIENYEMVTAGQVVVGLHDISRLEVKISVPENEIVNHLLKHGEPARVQFVSLARQQFEVALNEWNTSANKTSHTYDVIFVMEKPSNSQILPGMTAEVDWTDQNETSTLLTIPAKAVVTDSTGFSYVWVFNPERSMAFKRRVELGPLSGGSNIIVRENLNKGELIVTDGVDFIAEDMTLKTVAMNSLGKNIGVVRGSAQ